MSEWGISNAQYLSAVLQDYARHGDLTRRGRAEPQLLVYFCSGIRGILLTEAGGEAEDCGDLFDT